MQDKAMKYKPRPSKTRQCTIKQDKTRRYNMTPDKMRQDKTRHDYQIRQKRAITNNIRHDKIRHSTST